MPPLLLSVIVGVLGLGWPLNQLLRWFFPRLSRQATKFISVGVLIVAIIIAQVIVEYPTWRRTLKSWQREALLVNCPQLSATPGRITFFVGFAPEALEAEDYSHQLMDAFNACHLSAAYGYDPNPQDIVVNEQKVIVPPETNWLSRLSGVLLWVLHPSTPPDSALRLATALERAGVPLVWKPDIRLAGIDVHEAYRWPINGPDCILFVGTKPAWSVSAWYETQRAHLLFRAQYPPNANQIMIWAALIYGLLIFSVPVSLLAFSLRRS